MTELATIGSGVAIDERAILRTLKLNPEDPQTQALLLVCRRYQLDPVLRHMILVDGRPYITRDGLLHVAHVSGQLDGIEVVDQDETPSHWIATVAVYRRDMSRPFKYVGRYPKNGANKKYGLEMAVKTAEVAALRRAFDVAMSTVEEQWTDQAEPPETVWLSAADVTDLREQIEQHGDSREIWRWVRDELGVQGGRVTAGQAVAIRERLAELHGVGFASGEAADPVGVEVDDVDGSAADISTPESLPLDDLDVRDEA